MTNEQYEIVKIFMPHALREQERVSSNSIRFAHYTSAEVGLKILESKSILLRNSSLMNDFSEMRHGWECLKYVYNRSLGDRLKTILQLIQTDLPKIFESNFNAQYGAIENQTYLTSISEHANEGRVQHEDKFGRLSMWRAYAPKNGIAFIINNTALMGESNALGAYVSPVVYKSPESFEISFKEVISSMEKNIDLLKKLGGNYIHNMLLVTLKFAVQSTKHPSFDEEREWRIIYSPPTHHAPYTATENQKKPNSI